MKRDKAAKARLRKARKRVRKEQKQERAKYLGRMTKLEDLTEAERNTIIFNAFLDDLKIFAHWRPNKVRGAKITLVHSLVACGKPFEYCEITLKATSIKHRAIKDGEDRVPLFQLDKTLRAKVTHRKLK